MRRIERTGSFLLGACAALALGGCSSSSAQFTISGSVDGDVRAGVTLTLTPGGATVSTDLAGNYSFTGLAGGTYQLTPSLAGFQFTPLTRTVAVSGASVSGQGFTAGLAALVWDAGSWDQLSWQ